jgi:hypothetical protein
MEDIMKRVLGGFWQKSNKWLKTGWLITAGLSALYFGTIQPHQGYTGVAAEKSTSLSADQWDPVSMWRESLPERVFKGKESQLGGVVRLIADGGSEGQLPAGIAVTSS